VTSSATWSGFEIAPGTTLRRTISDFSSIPFRFRSSPIVPAGMSFFATQIGTFVSSWRTLRW
jgi:hypothetical protein